MEPGITDTTIAHIADYATALDFANLPAAVVHDCKRRLIDTVGCAVAGFDDEPSRIARAVALKGETTGETRAAHRFSAPAAVHCRSSHVSPMA